MEADGNYTHGRRLNLRSQLLPPGSSLKQYPNEYNIVFSGVPLYGIFQEQGRTGGS